MAIDGLSGRSLIELAITTMVMMALLNRFVVTTMGGRSILRPTMLAAA